MTIYSSEDLTAALTEVTQTIIKCEKMQGKFDEGTSQHSLLKNRIKAMYISSLLLRSRLSDIEPGSEGQRADLSQSTGYDRKETMYYTKEEMASALPPVISIIHKCEKARAKYPVEAMYYKRFSKIINAMYLARTLIEDQIASLS